MIRSDYACSDSEFTRQVLIFNCSVSTVVALFGGAIPALAKRLCCPDGEKKRVGGHGDRHDGNGACVRPKPKYCPKLLLDNFHVGGSVTIS
jgi:hypothetical protein